MLELALTADVPDVLPEGDGDAKAGERSGVA